jgi:tetratricopeptide (TPR) repeat protein
VLNHNHDKEGFTRCYQQLADKEPTAKNFALLGEAYLRILNPEAAIDALEQAYKLDPKNGRLRGRIGTSTIVVLSFHGRLCVVVAVVFSSFFLSFCCFCCPLSLRIDVNKLQAARWWPRTSTTERWSSTSLPSAS